ncbi:DedA family protein [Chelatococcus reniformis]|uniref:DedA family protein n=1 Tax=Chelatococcus reniformis TaxID=1494448 RepID=A0A916X6R0_9HYPH|nr:DedA family protein [Chelatococcus reniformis]GGC45953.1 DedA family protein [Chelatococcus reniformis]
MTGHTQLAPWLHEYIQHYGAWAVAVAIFLDSLGVPAPGEIMLIAGAGLASQGQLDPTALLVGAWCAAVLGDNVGYVIGRSLGAEAIVRFGARVGITAGHYAWAVERFRRWGPAVVAAARFVVVLRQINGLVAGSLRMPWAVFVAFNAIGALLWVGFWGSVVLAVGAHRHELSRFVHEPLLMLGVAIVVALGVGAVRYLRGRHSRREAAPATHDVADGAPGDGGPSV